MGQGCPKAETVNFIANTAERKSEDAYGFVSDSPPSGRDEGDRRCRVDRATDAKECKGKFASGRTSELVDSDVMFRGFSACEDSKGTRVSQYFVVPRDRAGLSSSPLERAPQRRGQRTCTVKRTSAICAKWRGRLRIKDF